MGLQSEGRDFTGEGLGEGKLPLITKPSYPSFSFSKGGKLFSNWEMT
jgi:hypothetical protein